MNTDLIEALSFRAAKRLIEASHCVELTIRTTLDAAFGITLKNRVLISDVRLNGGFAIGKVNSIQYEIGSSQEAEITLLCPITDPNFQRTADFFFEYFFGHDGPEDQVPPAPAVDALRGGNITAKAFFVDRFQIENLAAEQLAAIADHVSTNPNAIPLPDPFSAIPETSFVVDLADAEPVDLDELGDHEVRLLPAYLYLPFGILLA